MSQEDHMITDEQLLADLAQGNSYAGGQLYQRYKGILFSYFYNNCKHRERSEDLVQRTFEKVLRYHKNYKGQGSFKSWIFSIARNNYLDNYDGFKKRNEVKEVVLKNQNPEFEYAHGYEDRQLLEACLDTLDVDQKELLILSKLKGMKYEEISEISGLTVSNIKIKVFRIMKELRKQRAILLDENI